MKPYITKILHLYIYTQLSLAVFGQDLYLEVAVDGLSGEEVGDFLDYFTPQERFADYHSLEREVDSLINSLQRRGYIESRLDSLQRKNDSTYTAQLQLNNHYAYVALHLPDKLPVDVSNQIKILSVERRDSLVVFEFRGIESTLNAITRQLTADGHPFSNLQLQNLRPDETTPGTLLADLIVQIDSKRSITHIHIQGYENFPRPFLKYAVGLKTGVAFSRDDILHKSGLLENLGFARNIKPPEVLFTDEGTEVYLYLEKTNSNLFDGILGFTTADEERDTANGETGLGKLQLNGYLNLILGNNLNYGERLILNYKNDGNQQEQFFVKVETPFLFQTPLGMETSLNIFKRDTTFITTEQAIAATYRFSTTTGVSVGYKAFQSEDLQKNELLATDLRDFTARYATVGAWYRKPQNHHLFPFKTHVSLSNDIGTRTEAAGSALSSEQTELNTTKAPETVRQLRSQLDTNHLFNLNARNSFYVRSHTAALFSETYYTNELFRFGGINSIRGFDENSIDASLFSVFNTEYRYQLASDAYLHSIIDFAYFENNIAAIRAHLYSFGIGLGLATKAGLLHLNIANGKQDNQPFRFSDTQVHIRLNALF